MYFDPLYLVFSLPALVLALVAQWRVKSAFNKFSQVRTYRGMSGAQVARAMLNENQLQEVSVEETNGLLSDHYDPRSRTLRLSGDVYRSNSVAAVGVAAHEAGHALQHAQGYVALQARTAIVPVVQFGSWLGPLVFMLGFVLSLRPVAWLGVVLFGVVVVFSLVTLPVEFDASRRALVWLEGSGIAASMEHEKAKNALFWAAMTYVAAAVGSLAQLAYFLLMALNRREE
jgi:Zn-dependent membrane protease YugP